MASTSTGAGKREAHMVRLTTDDYLFLHLLSQEVATKYQPAHWSVHSGWHDPHQ